jgi:hypothetical protein
MRGSLGLVDDSRSVYKLAEVLCSSLTFDINALCGSRSCCVLSKWLFCCYTEVSPMLVNKSTKNKTSSSVRLQKHITAGPRSNARSFPGDVALMVVSRT